MRITKIDGIEYISRINPNGYGFEIIKRESLKGGKIRRSLVFQSYNSDLVKSIMDRFMDGEIVSDFPNTSDEVPPMKLLVYRSKHFIGYYNVPTLESLDKTLRYILKQEYKDYIKGMNPNNNVKNDSGVSSQEEIDSIPIETVRNSVQEKWDLYQKDIKENTLLKRDYENLRLVVEEDKGNSLIAMDVYERENYEIEDIIEIK